MKRDTKTLGRLIRAQKVIADKAQLAHAEARARLDRNEEDLAALDAHAGTAGDWSLALLDLYVERARVLAAEHEELANAAQQMHGWLVRHSAAIEPLRRRYRQAQDLEERTALERQLGELADRRAAVAPPACHPSTPVARPEPKAQACRKPRGG